MFDKAEDEYKDLVERKRIVQVQPLAGIVVISFALKRFVCKSRIDGKSVLPAPISRPCEASC